MEVFIEQKAIRSMSIFGLSKDEITSLVINLSPQLTNKSFRIKKEIKDLIVYVYVKREGDKITVQDVQKAHNKFSNDAVTNYDDKRSSTSNNSSPLDTTKVIFYNSKNQMQNGIRSMEANGWEVVNTQVHKPGYFCFIPWFLLPIFILIMMLFRSRGAYKVQYRKRTKQ